MDSLDFQRELFALQRQVDNLVQPEIPPFDPVARAVSTILGLPALRLFYPMSAVSNTPEILDLSGSGQDLTVNGNPVLNSYGLAPYIDLDGTGDYLSHIDNTHLDITGTETYIAPAINGLTIGGWTRIDVRANYDRFMTKWGVATTRSYQLLQDLAANKAMLFEVSVDGTAIVTVTADAGVLTTGVWHFVVGRFVPSTSLDIYIDGEKFTNVAGIPASIFNSTAAFVIGAIAGGTGTMDGRASMCYLCAAAHSDDIIDHTYQQTRGLFGV